MHIAFLNPQGNFDPRDSHWTEHPDFGGQLVYVKEVAIALARAGHRVDILTRQILDPAWPEFASLLDGYPGVDNLRILRISCGPRRFLRKEDLWPWLGSEWVPRILAFYEEEGGLPDIFTAHYADGGLSAALLERRTDIPFTFTAHSLGAQKLEKLSAPPADFAQLEARYHFRQRIAAERISMNRAGVIITSTRQERMRQYGHPLYRGAVDVNDDRRFAVIPPGVNLRIFAHDRASNQEDATQAAMEASLARDLPPARRSLPLILISARLDPKKNHLGLFRAYAQNPELQARANLALVVRGTDAPLREIERFPAHEQAVLRACWEVVQAHGLEDKVVTLALNSQQALAAAYRHLAQRRSLFCLPALYEPFGLAPLEAMAAGLPVVVTRHGGPSESLRDEITGKTFGVLVDPDDPADIARGLLRPLQDAALWRRLRQAGIQRVRSRYTWEQTARGYETALRAVLAAREPIPQWFLNPAIPDLPALDVDNRLSAVAQT